MESASRTLAEVPEGRDVLAVVRSMRAMRSKPSEPVIVVEGLDGVGKRSLCAALAQHLGAKQLSSPPQQLRGFRSHFDAEGPQLRRAFYAVGNYAAAFQVDGPTVLDRFWPSTAAYAAVCDGAEVAQMPLDLQELLPDRVVWLYLEAPEWMRQRRLAARGQLTEEEKRLKSGLAKDLSSVYRSLSMGGDRFHVIDASGSLEDVLQGALRAISACEESWSRVPRPISVNWHFTRQCNYSCKFCFHTAKSSFFLPRTREGMEESKRCLERLKAAGMEKLNFSGGEPFLQAAQLGELATYCKEQLRLPSVTIVSNGSLITRKWMEKYGRYIDIIAISCDSFREETNIKVGRGKGEHVRQLENVRDWCREFNVDFKINTVVNALNVEEDMSSEIRRLAPRRWKVFQCLLIDGENAGPEALRDAKELTITEAQFQGFLERHSSVQAVPESNEAMVNSYLILDEHLCFLNCTEGTKKPSPSIREVPVTKALRRAGFDEDMFRKRGGVYDWSKRDIEDLASTAVPKTRKVESKENDWNWVLLFEFLSGSMGTLALLATHRKR